MDKTILSERGNDVDANGRDTRTKIGGALAMAGGALMVYSGYASRGFLISALKFAEQDVTSMVGGAAGLTLEVAIGVLALLVALGGFTIFAGGVAVLKRALHDR
ncbi:MAG: hypothetical protein HY297_01040 [Thaumarchaeota archaeon]|nr:hypothetical protein [Nitrososphaerota archaeon]